MRKGLVTASFFFLLFSCQDSKDRFKLITSADSGIEFNNIIQESDSFNILTYEYIYNGGGVAIADFDNNGLKDIYFTGNRVGNELYLNEGELKFKNVTKEAGVNGDGKWCSSVAVVDINADGWLDIYVCATASPIADLRKNIFYINKGLNADGVPVFENQAARYHVDDDGHSTAAAFLDYDKDGDLDLFVAVNKMTNGKTANVYSNKESFEERVDKLFRNDWDSTASHPVFTNVSSSAGIVDDGYSLGVNVTDINQDGWSDIFVTNDYLTNDLVYINQHDGTFKNMAADYFKHTSYSAMGNDVVDFNNDAKPDVIAVDMLPEDNYRRKTMLGPNNYTTYINNEKYGLQYQYIRNTLQLNQGIDPVTGIPVFSEVSLLAGISSTDWSWTPLVADFDNDGFRDVIITNGFPKDVTDRDFVDYYAQAGNYASKSFLMTFMPSVKIKNYAYRNTGGFVFEDVTDSWGIKVPSFSNGAAYADLDNDGDLDYVVNNINDKAFLYENLTDRQQDKSHNWLRVKLVGPKTNPQGLGAKLRLYTKSGILYADHSTYRGYLSCMEPELHFGLGAAEAVDSVEVQWPDGAVEIVTNVKANQVLSFDISKSHLAKRHKAEEKLLKIFEDVSALLPFVHQENDFVDFNIQALLLHKFSQYGPGIAVGDVDGNGLDDLYIGGSLGKPGTFFIQESDGRFKESKLIEDEGLNRHEQLGVLLLDVDTDGDLDLFCANGGYERIASDSAYKQTFYENKDGRFVRKDNALPNFLVSASCVRAADFDQDGDLDIFLGGRVVPQQFPKPVSSYLLRNDSKPGQIRFTDVTTEHAEGLKDIGLVCDGLWTDFDQDGWVDLIVVGEWMPIRFFKNQQGKLTEITDTTGISQWTGWWNSITAADFDLDGDMDYVVGNLGLNALVKASVAEPVTVYSGDFDGNGVFDNMPTAYFKDKNGEKKEFPYFGRLDIQKELIRVKRSFLKHADFATATIDMVLTPEQLKNVSRANIFTSSYIENKGSGKFEIRALPIEAQLAPLYGMVAEDINQDNKVDLICVGNDFGTEVSVGRYDALNGLTLLGDGKGNFESIPLSQSGLSVKGDAKALVSLRNNSGSSFLIASQNRGPIRAFRNQPSKVLAVAPDVANVKIILTDGSYILKEVYYGSGFLSQSSRKISLPANTKEVVLTTFKGAKKHESNF